MTAYSETKARSAHSESVSEAQIIVPWTAFLAERLRSFVRAAEIIFVKTRVGTNLYSTRTDEDGARVIHVSNSDDLFRAWQQVDRSKSLILTLADGDYELPTPLELSAGRVTICGVVSTQSATCRLLPWARRIACTVVSMVVSGVSWRTRAVGLSVVLLGSEWLYSSVARERLIGGRKTRFVARDGAFILTGGELHLQDISMASLGVRALARCTRSSTLHMRNSDLGCMSGNGIECDNDATVIATNCAIANCGRSGIALFGRGSCRLSAQSCSFLRNRRFGCELQGGKAAIITRSVFDDCGVCVSDREIWQPDSLVVVESCLLRGCAACLPGLSVIGDSMPTPTLALSDQLKDDAPAASQWNDAEWLHRTPVLPADASRLPWDVDGQKPSDQLTSRGIIFDQCTIEGVNGAGIYLLGKSTVCIRSCTVRNVSMAGIEALRGSSVSVIDSKIQHNAGGGVILHRGARGILSSCEILSNGGGGNIGIMDGASCELRNCRISLARAVGIQICHASAVVLGCRVERSGDAGIVLGGIDSRSCRDLRRPTVEAIPQHSHLTIRNSDVCGSGSSSLFVAPHSTLQHHCYNESCPETIEHTIVAQECKFADMRHALRIEAPANGCFVGNDCIEPTPSDFSAWRGTRRMRWSCERVLHCGASPSSESLFRHLKEPSLRRLIVEFAS